MAELEILFWLLISSQHCGMDCTLVSSSSSCLCLSSQVLRDSVGRNWILFWYQVQYVFHFISFLYHRSCVFCILKLHWEFFCLDCVSVSFPSLIMATYNIGYDGRNTDSAPKGLKTYLYWGACRVITSLSVNYCVQVIIMLHLCIHFVIFFVVII